MKRVVIIGGGLGGLASATRLAVQGHHVTLCEAGPTLGGKMNTFESRGYRFDTGPSLITMPGVFEETFAAAGELIEDHISLQRLEPVAEYVWPDGTRLQHGSSLPQWLDVVKQLEPRDVKGFWKFMKLGARLLELSNETFLRRAPTEAPDWRTLKALRFLPLRRAWGNYARVVNDLFVSPQLRQLFLRYPTYVGSSPWRSPATLLVIPYLEYAYGGWFAQGGLYRIVQAIAAIARARGAELRVNAPVEAIDTTSGRVKSVRLHDGTRFESDVVVMNGDASMLKRLMKSPTDEGLRPQERSMSGFLTLAGLPREMPGLHHHTVFFSADYEHEFRQLIDEARFPDDPTVYVNAPSRSDRSLVPGDGETLFIMANAPARSEPWDEAATRDAQSRVFTRLRASGFHAIDGELPVLEHWTPRRIEQAYRMPGGAIYGRHSHGWRGAFMRPANRQRTRGLYVVGGSGHPGGGTPTVLLSAKITSELIARHERD